MGTGNSKVACAERPSSVLEKYRGVMSPEPSSESSVKNPAYRSVYSRTPTFGKSNNSSSRFN